MDIEEVPRVINISLNIGLDPLSVPFTTEMWTLQITEL